MGTGSSPIETVKTNRPHQCVYCAGIIPEGTRDVKSWVWYEKHDIERCWGHATCILIWEATGFGEEIDTGWHHEYLKYEVLPAIGRLWPGGVRWGQERWLEIRSLLESTVLRPINTIFEDVLGERDRPYCSLWVSMAKSPTTYFAFEYIARTDPPDIRPVFAWPSDADPTDGLDGSIKGGAWDVVKEAIFALLDDLPGVPDAKAETLRYRVWAYFCFI